jgi:hypothetical protein
MRRTHRHAPAAARAAGGVNGGQGFGRHGVQRTLSTVWRRRAGGAALGHLPPGCQGPFIGASGGGGCIASNHVPAPAQRRQPPRRP